MHKQVKTTRNPKMKPVGRHQGSGEGNRGITNSDKLKSKDKPVPVSVQQIKLIALHFFLAFRAGFDMRDYCQLNRMTCPVHIPVFPFLWDGCSS